MKPRNRPPSQQTFAVLDAVANAQQEWSYGLEISKATGLKSGSLYPILMRLNERGMLDSCWLEPERPGRPPRHGYRLTAKGAETLREAQQHPENYRDLIVRVAGYSDYFVDLTPELQEEIIRRTEHISY